MKPFLRSTLLLLAWQITTGLPATAQVALLPLNEADRAYEEERYHEAEVAYRAELEKGYEPRLRFNLGDALFQQGKYPEALQEFQDASATAEDAQLRSGALYNEANTWMELDSLDRAVTAYKKAIRNNPQDMEARYNLAVAQRIKERQERKKQEQQDKEQEKEKQEENQQQSGDEQQQSSNNQQQDSQEQSSPESSSQQQPSGQSEQEKEEDNKEQASQAVRPAVTEQEARRLLRIMEEEEQKTIERQRQRSAPSRKPEKDW